MKNIKNIIKKSCLLGIATLVAANIFPMRMSEASKKSLQSYVQKQKQQQKPQYFIHEMNDESNGIWVDKEVAEKCRSIKAMVEDLGGRANNIPLNVPIHIIKLVFGILAGAVDVDDLSFEELIDVANACNFLDVPEDKMKSVLAEIKEVIDRDVENIVRNAVLKKLNFDLQKLVMTEPVISCLKDCVAQKYTKNRGKRLIDRSLHVDTLAISPDGTKIIAGYVGYPLNLMICDISNLNNIISHFLGAPFNITSVVFSPDGKYCISSSYDYFILAQTSELILWNISDLNNITHQALDIAVQDRIKLLAFSSNDKRFFSCGSKLIAWDISNPNNITHQELLGDLQDPVVLSPDGIILASGMLNNDNVTLWDVRGSKAIPYAQIGEKNFGKINHLAFSVNGKNIVSVGDKLILWNISDLNNITGKVLIDDVTQLSINCLILSHDGKKIALGYREGFVLLDINNPNNRLGIDKIGEVSMLAFTPDNKQIITQRGDVHETNLILWTLLSDQEDTLLKQIQNYNIDQVLLIYQWCLQASKKQSITLKKGSEEQKIFMTLPEDMQKLLTDLFLPKGWLFGWWS